MKATGQNSSGFLHAKTKKSALFFLCFRRAEPHGFNQPKSYESGVRTNESPKEFWWLHILLLFNNSPKFVINYLHKVHIDGKSLQRNRSDLPYRSGLFPTCKLIDALYFI